MKEQALTFLQKRLKFDVRFVFKGSFWLMIGHLVGVTSALVTSYAFANFLSPEIYGQYKYIISAGVLLTTFSLTGTETSIIQAAAKNLKGFYEYIRKINLQYSLIISLISLIGAVYYFIQGNVSLAIGLVLIAFFQPLFNNSFLFYSYLQGKQEFKLSTISHAIKAIFTTVIIVTSTLLTENVTLLLVSYFSSYIIINYLLQYFLAPTSTTVPEQEQTRSLLKYTKHTSVQNVVSGISNNLDKILVFQNLGAVELAIYAFSTAMPDQYKGFTKTVESMLLPRFSQRSDSSIREGVLYKSVIYFLFVIAFALLYIAIAPYIFSAFFPQYMSAVFLSQIYATSIIFSIGSIPLIAIKSKMLNRKLYHFNLASSLFQVIILLVLLPIWGLLGAIIAKVLYRGFVCGYAYYLYYSNY